MNRLRVAVMVRKELRQLARDPRLKRVLFIAPVIQLMVFGYAVSTDIRHTATFVVDLDGTPASRAFTTEFMASGYFRQVGSSRRPAEMVRALDRGAAAVGLVIPAGFARDLAAERARVQILLDGTNSNLALVARGYAERIVLAQAQSQAQAARPPAVDLRARAWYNPDLESRNYNVPAVIGVIIMLICLLLTSLAIVREREVGTLEQLRVSPLTPGELILGKLVPFALIGLVDMAVITVVALFWFGVPLRGSVLLLLGASILFLLSGLGVGLLISTISRTQQEAFMAAFLVFMPSLLLSGFMFPVQSMPRLFQELTLLNPLRQYLEIVRALFLKGAGFDALWRQFLTLAAMGIAILWLAAARFRRVAG